MSLNQICSNGGVNTFTPSVSLRELNISNNINFGSDVKISEPSPAVLQVQSNELKFVQNDNLGSFRAFKDGIYTHVITSNNDTGGVLFDLNVPSSETPYDLRMSVGTAAGQFIQHKDNLLFQDSAGNQELLIIRGAGTAGIQLPNSTSGYVQTTLNYYEEFAANFAVSGLTGNTINLVRVVRVGKLITLTWSSSLAGNGTGAQIVLASLPLRLRPVGTVSMACPVLENGTGSDGNVQVDSVTGNLTFSSNANFATFTNAQPAGIYSGSISYIAA